MNTSISEVYFNAGCVKQPGNILVSSKLEELDDSQHQFSRLFIYKEGSWGKKDIDDWDIVSVCRSKELAALCALSKEGEVLLGMSNGFTEEKIAEAGVRKGIHGYLSHIREIGKTLFACGQGGQIYKRGQAGWLHFDDGLLTPRAADSGVDAFLDSYTFNCIDGFNESDIYVVGDDAALCHFDGNQWRKIVIASEEHLQWVRCYNSNEVWICGYNGTLLRGNAEDGFVDVSSADDNQTFWSLAKFREKVYLAAVDDLYVYGGDQIEAVQSRLDPEISSYCLDSCNEELWSIGPKDIAMFDGVTWTRIDHPDNPPIR